MPKHDKMDLLSPPFYSAFKEIFRTPINEKLHFTPMETKRARAYPLERRYLSVNFGITILIEVPMPRPLRIETPNGSPNCKRMRSCTLRMP